MRITSEDNGLFGSPSGAHATASHADSSTNVCGKSHASAVARATSAGGGSSTEPHQSPHARTHVNVTAEGERMAGWLGSLSGAHAAASHAGNSAGVGGMRHAGAVAGATSAGGGSSTAPHRAKRPART